MYIPLSVSRFRKNCASENSLRQIPAPASSLLWDVGKKNPGKQFLLH